jgi:protein-disulfide isomerase
MKPTKFLACAVALVAIAGCNSKQGDAATNAGAPATNIHVAPPKNGDWTTVVTATPAGGFLMGNPQAKVQLIEFGSMTCPHCREFDETGVGPLIDQYVKTGKVGYEFRNYVRDPYDLAASLIARCNGAKSFFPLERALYKDQMDWITRIQAVPQDKLEALSNLPPKQQFLEIGKLAGFQDWAAARGVPQAKTTQCLTDEKAINQLVQMNSDTTTQFPDFQGTPTFVINGKLYEIKAGTPTWDQLKAGLDKALGG